jgi:hypothetical protein
MLKRLNIIKNVYELTYRGKIFSLNDLYRQGHWSVRSNLKSKYRSEFLALLQENKVKFCKEFFIIIFYNTRHDVDNIVGVAKVMVDSMKGEYISDDNKRFYKGMSIFADGSLEKNTVEFLIIEKNED